MMFGERILEAVAREVGKDPLEVRKLNFYSTGSRNITPYHMEVEDFNLDKIVDELERSSSYWERRDKIKSFNKNNYNIRK